MRLCPICDYRCSWAARRTPGPCVCSLDRWPYRWVIAAVLCPRILGSRNISPPFITRRQRCTASRCFPLSKQRTRLSKSTSPTGVLGPLRLWGIPPALRKKTIRFKSEAGGRRRCVEILQEFSKLPDFLELSHRFTSRQGPHSRILQASRWIIRPKRSCLPGPRLKEVKPCRFRTDPAESSRCSRRGERS